MYLMRSRRKIIKPPVQDKAVEGDAPADKSKTTGTDQKSKDQTDGMCVFYMINEHLILYCEMKHIRATLDISNLQNSKINKFMAIVVEHT